jgi:hypothetical protein
MQRHLTESAINASTVSLLSRSNHYQLHTVPTLEVAVSRRDEREELWMRLQDCIKRWYSQWVTLMGAA